MKPTQPCYYCGGTGEIFGMDSRCPDCLGQKVLCILCHEPPRCCRCAESRFDEDTRKQARDEGKPF
jgi:hypothetical protein